MRRLLSRGLIGRTVRASLYVCFAPEKALFSKEGWFISAPCGTGGLLLRRSGAAAALVGFTARSDGGIGEERASISISTY